MSETRKNRSQKVYVIQRLSDGMFCSNIKSPAWSPDISEADFCSASKFKGIIRAEWGRDLADYRMVEVVPALAEAPAPDAAGLRFTGLHPTPFGDMIGVDGYPPETMMLVSVCGASGIKPVRCILWHQLYLKDLPALEAQGEVVICAVPFATAHFGVSAALSAWAATR